MRLKGKKCLDNLESVLHHHCGHHKLCSHDCCKNKQIELRIKAKQRFYFSRSKSLMTEFEILKAFEEEYAKIRRFKGRCIDISERGQIEIKKVILKRITQDNIDRLANITSCQL